MRRPDVDLRSAKGRSGTIAPLNVAQPPGRTPGEWMRIMSSAVASLRCRDGSGVVTADKIERLLDRGTL